MGEHVVIEHGHVRIDAAGWVAQRTGDEHVELTVLLQEWDGWNRCAHGSAGTG